MRGDTYNIGPTVPALFEAHERRYKAAVAEIERLEKENGVLRAYIDGLKALLKEIRPYLPKEVTVYQPDGCYKRPNGEAVVELRQRIDYVLRESK